MISTYDRDWRPPKLTDTGVVPESHAFVFHAISKMRKPFETPIYSSTAASSYGFLPGLPLQYILKASGWSNSEVSTRHLNKQLAQNFGHTIYGNANHDGYS